MKRSETEAALVLPDGRRLGVGAVTMIHHPWTEEAGA